MNAGNEDPVATLLKLAGPRPRPDADRSARVRAAVHEEWRGTTERRRWTRIGIGAAIAATLAGVLLFRLPKEVATLGRIVETPPQTVASIDWNGATLRLDGGTRIRIESPTAATLERGTIYFSSEAEHAGVTIRTPFGTVRDIGTQFEVRLGADDVRVRVREGLVDVRGTTASAGTELTATRTAIVRGSVPDDAFAWVERSAPRIILEGQTLEAVLHRAAREKGLRVEWNGVARGTRLHGSIALSPDEAIEAAAAASGVDYRIEGTTLIVQGRR